MGTCGSGQRTTLWSQLSPSVCARCPGSELRSLDLLGNAFPCGAILSILLVFNFKDPHVTPLLSQVWEPFLYLVFSKYLKHHRKLCKEILLKENGDDTEEELKLSEGTQGLTWVMG